MMNYSKSLIEQFTFIILLATLNTLVPCVFCSLAELMIRRKLSHASFSLSGVSVFAFAFSLWAIAGAGQEIVYWFFLLLMLGVPVYVWIHRGRSGSLQ